MIISRSGFILMSANVVGLSLMIACGGSDSGLDDDAAAASAGFTIGLAGDGMGGNGTAGNGTAGSTVGGGANPASGSSSGGTTAGGAGAVPERAMCGGVPCACDDGMDNDEDGLIDGFDPECTGPYDNDEGSFATGIPGDNRDPKWQDCFFDGNSGAGDDGCRYHTDCLTGDLPSDHKDCTLTQQCIEFCAPRTPNGCDCFGCCTVQKSDGSSVDILTGTGCSLNAVDDTDACPPCVKAASCENTCGRCELCPGKTVSDLPEDCRPTGEGGAGGMGSGGRSGSGGTGGTPDYTCDNGTVCSEGMPCAVGQYCQLGCCMYSPR